MIPLAPYIFLQQTSVALLYSVGFTLVALLIFGFVKGKFTGTRPVKSALQTALIGSAAAVVFELVQFGSLPWIALVLACSFAFYGLVRKKLGVDSFTGMALETGLLLPVAMGYLLFTTSPTSDLTANPAWTNLLLFAAGPITMVPLMCFAAAANRISLTALGFFQYIGPTGMFLLAVFVYDEPLSPEKLVTFGLIWTALAILTFDSLYKLRRRRLIVPT
jgi:chloramphenicol-sensitive protein RarD